jgi:hypothetical protein
MSQHFLHLIQAKLGVRKVGKVDERERERRKLHTEK